MTKYNRLGEEVREVMFDTNIISNLMRLKSIALKNLLEKSAYENSKHLKHYWETVYLNRALRQELEEEDFFKAKKVHLFVSGVVLKEMANANMAYAKYKDCGEEITKYRNSMVNGIREFDINIVELLEREGKLFEYVVSLIKGENQDFPEFDSPAIKLTSNKDILICAHAIIKNKPLVTQDNHFIGGNNEHRNEICRRIDAAKGKIQKKFNVELNTPKIQTVPEFLEENYNEIYCQYLSTMKRSKEMGL